MIKQNRLNNCGYLLLSGISFVFLMITTFQLVRVPNWDVTNWYVIAFSNSLITLILIQLPWIMNRLIKWSLNPRQTLIFYSFIFLTLIVGEAIGVYRITTWYDAVIHVIGGFILALIGYEMYHYLSKENNLKLEILFILGFQAFMGTLWELFEFGMDTVVGSNSQSYFDDIFQQYFIGQAALYDTMTDFLYNTLGAILCIWILIWVRKKQLDVL